jgi:TonB family protein
MRNVSDMMNTSRHVFICALFFSAIFHGAVFLLISGIPAKPINSEPESVATIINLFNLDFLEPEIPLPELPLPTADDSSPEENAVPEVADIIPDQVVATAPSQTGTSDAPPVTDIPAASTPALDPSRREDAINRYAGKVRSLIDSCKEYPYQSRRQEQEGTVIVRFVLTRNGLLEGAPSLERKCRYERLNASALEAVRKAVPYPPFPLEMPDEKLSFSVAVVFSLR